MGANAEGALQYTQLCSHTGLQSCCLLWSSLGVKWLSLLRSGSTTSPADLTWPRCSSLCVCARTCTCLLADKYSPLCPNSHVQAQLLSSCSMPRALQHTHTRCVCTHSA